ncbi:MAG: hypothetical protein M1826_004171 [Phylliscum demangeonii]|nr:MAG: hypothetical protein M1826_004171 [Phylliscum demangeonii]
MRAIGADELRGPAVKLNGTTGPGSGRLLAAENPTEVGSFATGDTFGAIAAPRRRRHGRRDRERELDRLGSKRAVRKQRAQAATVEAGTKAARATEARPARLAEAGMAEAGTEAAPPLG